MELKQIKSNIYQQTFINAYTKDGISIINRLVIALISLAVVVSILDTEPALQVEYGVYFSLIEYWVSVLFAFEYLFRLWAVTENPIYRGWRGRIRYMLSPLALIDLVSFLPALLSYGMSDSLILRIVRMARFARFARLGQYSKAISLIGSAVSACWRELVVSYIIAMFILVFSAGLLFVVEAEVQPEAFGSIPRALWWSLATLTTVGYGDVYPISALGKFCAGFIALTGIGLVSMPTAILAGSFAEQFKKQREKG